MNDLARRVTDSQAFASGVGMLILANAAAMGLETVDTFAHRYPEALFVFFWVSQVLFVGEITLRFLAWDGTWRSFLADRWNRFDTVIVLASLLPVGGILAPLARLLRVLRVLRAISSFEALRELVEPRGANGGVLAPLAVVLGVFWYGWAVAGYTLFAEVDPGRWGDLFGALRSVFYLTVFTDVSAIVGPVTDTSMGALCFFVAFYLTLGGILLQAVSVAVHRPAPTAED